MSDYPTLEETQLRNLDRFDTLGRLVGKLADELEDFRRGMAAMAEVMATQSDLDDVRRELRAAVATPFDPPEAA